MNRDKYTPLGLAFAEKLRTLRSETSQDKLAEKTGMSQSRIARIEKGSEPRASELIAFSEYFGVSICELLDLQESSNGYIPTMPDALKSVYPDLEYIYRSQNSGIQQALTSNVREFKGAIERDANRDARINELEKIVRELKRREPPVSSDSPGGGSRSGKQKAE